METEFLLEDLFKQKRGVQRQPFPVFVIFQVPTTENNQHTNMVYLGWHALSAYMHILGWAYSATLSPTTFVSVG